MFKRLKTLALATLMGLMLAMPCYAAEEGTLDEAKALAHKAAEYVKEVGRDAAIAEFNKPQSQFIDRDLV